MTNNLTVADARERWGDPNRIAENEVERACPWCASWLRNDGKSEGVFEKVVECKNLMCPLLPTGGCYWEPWPDGWTDENKRRQPTRKLRPDSVSINGEKVEGIESLDITEGSIDDVVREFKDPSDKTLNIRVKGTSARGMMGACFAKILEEETRLIDPITWSKWTRLKQLVSIVFRPWKVWDLHDRIYRTQDHIDLLLDKLEDKEDKINDLLEDVDKAIEQRDQAKAIARKAMIKK